MADLDLNWRGDFDLTPAGDLLLADGPDLTQQRILRRLFTARSAYIWHLGYGAGLPQRIGRVARESVIASIVRSQIALEKSVAAIPPPTIKVSAAPSNPGLFVIAIAYSDAVTGEAISIQLEVPGTE